MMEHIDGSISVGITASFSITKPLGVSEWAKPCAPAQEGYHTSAGSGYVPYIRDFD